MSNENSLYILVSEGPDKPWIKKDAGPITRWWKRPSTMDKTKRWMSEHIAPGRWIGEQVSSEYSQQMDLLRDVHSQVEEWTKDLSNALDRAQDARKLGKPLDSIFWLGQINNRLKLVADEKSKLQDAQNKYLEQYFLEHEESIPDDYFETGKHRIVEAGVFDDLGRQLTTWKFQKAHKLRLKEQDAALKKLLGLAKTVVGRTYTSLKDMSSALGNGDISHYLQSLEKVSKQQGDFESEFRTIYNEHFAAMVERIKEKKKQETERATKIKEEADQREKERLQAAGLLPADPAAAPQTVPSASLPQPPPAIPSLSVPAQPPPSSGSVVVDLSAPSSQDLPISVPPKAPPVPKPFEFVEDPEQREIEWKRKKYKGKPEELAPETQPDTSRSPKATASSELEGMIIKLNHARFQEELKRTAAKSNDPYLLAAMMLKYSEMIDELDPQKSLELLAIAEGILNA